MLTKPLHGSTDFSLEGTASYGLSYLDDIAFEWVEQAIHGLETLLPFCVKGFLEPGRLICNVSYWNCYIIIESDERYPLQKENIAYIYSHTSMLEFCKYLYMDISNYIDEWVSFVDYCDDNLEEKRQKLISQIEKLKRLIDEKEEYFDQNHGFL